MMINKSAKSTVQMNVSVQLTAIFCDYDSLQAEFLHNSVENQKKSDTPENLVAKSIHILLSKSAMKQIHKNKMLIVKSSNETQNVESNLIAEPLLNLIIKPLPNPIIEPVSKTVTDHQVIVKNDSLIDEDLKYVHSSTPDYLTVSGHVNALQQKKISKLMLSVLAAQMMVNVLDLNK